MSSEEFLRWYWLKWELVAFAGQLGVRQSGSKAMREFFASADGTSTLGDALNHYAMTRGDMNETSDPQFEYSRLPVRGMRRTLALAAMRSWSRGGNTEGVQSTSVDGRDPRFVLKPTAGRLLSIDFLIVDAN